MDEIKQQGDDKALLKHSKVHVSKSTKYEDNQSTGYSFLTVGGFILVFLALCQFGILHFPVTFATQPVMVSMLLVMGIGFIVGGILSLKKAKEFKAGIAAEEQEETKVISDFLAVFDAASIDAAAGIDGDARDEILSLERMDFMKEKLLTMNPDLDDAHAESICETLYSKIFEA